MRTRLNTKAKQIVSSVAADCLSGPKPGIAKCEYGQASQSGKLPVRRSGPLWIVLGVALLIRIALPLAALATHHDTSVFLENDTESYVRPAQALLTSGAFATAGHPEIVRTPGYPIFLVPGLLSGHLTAVTIALQVLISTLTVLFVYLTAKILFSSSTAYCCASVYAIEPLSVFYSSQLLSETLFAFILVVFLYQTARYMKHMKLPMLLSAALALAAATYVRPISYYLPIVLVPIIIYTSAQVHRRSKAVVHGLAFLLFCFALMAPWQMRNYHVSGYSGLSSIGEQNLYFYRGASIIAAKTGRSFFDVQKELGFNSWAQYDRTHPEQASWSDAQKYGFMRWEGLRLIKNNLRVYLPIHFKGMAKVIANPGGVVYGMLFKKVPTVLNPTDALTALKTLRTAYPFSFYTNICLGLLLLCSMVSAGIGAALAWSRERIATVLLITVAFYFVLVSSGAESAGRFRHPIMPIVCLFAGHALVFLSHRLPRMHKTPSRQFTYLGIPVQNLNN